ncbi:hypothetical protein ABFT23_01525 [Nocardioides sp. C4-1]|uniref:hypothetical protein n=1 Tax=Nocardioides sp. C4-1 TaxID=3151851 RepID=UPI0032674FCB
MTGPFRVRAANLYVRNPRAADDAPVLVEDEPHLVAVSEARGGWESVLPAIDGYQYLGRRPGDRGSHGSREVGLLVRDDVQVVDADVVQLSEAVPRSLVAHDRWGVWARLVLPGGVRALGWSTHRNAFVQRPDGGVRRSARGTAEYRAHVRAETELQQRQADDGWPLLGGGDYNYRVPCGLLSEVDRAWGYAPHRVFPAAGFSYVPHGLDGICLDPRAFAPVDGLEVIPRRRTGSDHDWITLTVRAS